LHFALAFLHSFFLFWPSSLAVILCHARANHLKISLAPQSITCDTGKINKENMAKIHGKIVEQKGKKFHETQKGCNEAVEWVGGKWGKAGKAGKAGAMGQLAISPKC